MNTQRLDRLIQYALACARESEDWRDRSLATTELVKYVYLGDLAYAERHGETFTGAPWCFLHFGPWAAEVDERLEPATRNVGGEVELFEKDHGPGRSFRVIDGGLKERLERDLPPYVLTAIRKSVREYGSQARSDLLHHVYLTHPILSAAPGEALRFDDLSSPAKDEPAPSYTPKEEKRRREKLRRLKEKIAELRSKPRTDGRVVVRPSYSPAVLDALARLRIEDVDEDEDRDESGTLVIGEDVWKSPGRRDDLP